MKARVYLRVARSEKRGSNPGFKVAANVKPNQHPLEASDGWLPTASFAVDLDIPDVMFDRASEVLAEPSSEVPENLERYEPERSVELGTAVMVEKPKGRFIHVKDLPRLTAEKDKELEKAEADRDRFLGKLKSARSIAKTRKAMLEAEKLDAAAELIEGLDQGINALDYVLEFLPAGDPAEPVELPGEGQVEEAVTPVEGVEKVAEAFESALGGPQFKHDVRVVYVRMLARKMVEFDAWLSFRPEFAEVLTAYRSAFGTDTSATASTPQSPQPRPGDGSGVEGGLRERLLDEIEKARQWKVNNGQLLGPELTEEEVGAGGVHVISLDDFNAALDRAFDSSTQQPQLVEAGGKAALQSIEEAINECRRIETDARDRAKEGLPNSIARAEGEGNVAQIIGELLERELHGVEAGECEPEGREKIVFPTHRVAALFGRHDRDETRTNLISRVERDVEDMADEGEHLAAASERLGLELVLRPNGTGENQPRLGSVVDLDGRNVNIELPSGETAAVVGYITRRQDGELELASRGDEDLHRDQIIAALQPQDEQPGAETCKRCGNTTAIWSASSPLWNAVMRGGSIDGEPLFDDMVCATCFMQLAEEQGIASVFRVTADKINLELETVTPSGRVWDERSFLWVDPDEPRCGGSGEEPLAPLSLGDIGGLLEAVDAKLAADLPEKGKRRRYNEIRGKLLGALTTRRLNAVLADPSDCKEPEPVSEEGKPNSAQQVEEEVAYDEERDTDAPARCPDDGACHHSCGPFDCFRVRNCAPLSEYGPEWKPEDVEKFAPASTQPSSIPVSEGENGSGEEGEQRVTFVFHPECLEGENVREFHPEIVGTATGALRAMLDPEKDERAHRDADVLASCAVSEALKALVTVATLEPVSDLEEKGERDG